MNFKNAAVKPRKSMLGTHKMKRDSILPFLPGPVSTPCHSTSTLDSTSTGNQTLTDDNTVRVSDEGTTLTRRDSVLPALTESEPSLVTDSRDSRKSIHTSQWTTSVSSNRIYDFGDCTITHRITTFSEAVDPAEENTLVLDSSRSFYQDALSQSTTNESVLSPTPQDTTTSFSASDGHVIPSKRLDVIFSPESNDDSFIELETMMANEDSVLTTSVTENNESTIDQNSILATTLKDTPEKVDCSTIDSSALEDTLNAKSNMSCDSTNEDSELRKMLTLMDAWIERNVDSVNAYTKQLEELQQRIVDSNKEIADIKNMKQLLINKFKLAVAEKENIPEKSEFPSLAMNSLRNLCQTSASQVSSPSKLALQEIRSTIKFLKTPRMSRAPKRSVMLTPHSMSFCIKNQFEQLLQ